MDNELLELCKEVYRRFPEWDNKSNTPSGKRLKVWVQGYSISEMGEAHDNYETTPPEERNTVNTYDWEIRDDPRHKITTGQEVFSWWYSRVREIEQNTVPDYTSDYLLGGKLPPVIQDPDDKKFKVLTMWINGDGTAYAAYVEPYAHDDRAAYAQKTDGMRMSLLKLVIALDDAGVKL